MHVDGVRLEQVIAHGELGLGLVRLGRDAQRRDVAERDDDALGMKEPECELDVVPRCAHDDRERLAIEQQLQWLLGSDLIAGRVPFACVVSTDANRTRRCSGHTPMLGAHLGEERLVIGRNVEIRELSVVVTMRSQLVVVHVPHVESIEREREATAAGVEKRRDLGLR